MIYVDTSFKIPELVDTQEFKLNGWVSPDGVFYGIEGAKHLLVATFIGICVLMKDESVLNHGKYFKDSWDSYLRRNKWMEIKDTSWIDGEKNVQIFGGRTQKQLDTLFDYCLAMDVDYKKLIEDE